jgi:hypothetical protein
MRNTVRFAVFGLLIAASFVLAPAAFARGHWNVGVNIGLPGVSLGYSDCRHCGWGGNYYGGGYYSGYYAPAYYAPAYYEPAYYGPSYYSYPAYGAVYYGGYGGRSSHRYYDRGRDHHYRDDRGRGDYGHRATYYDRGGDYRH